MKPSNINLSNDSSETSEKSRWKTDGTKPKPNKHENLRVKIGELSNYPHFPVGEDSLKVFMGNTFDPIRTEP